MWVHMVFIARMRGSDNTVLALTSCGLSWLGCCQYNSPAEGGQCPVMSDPVLCPRLPERVVRERVSHDKSTSATVAV